MAPQSERVQSRIRCKYCGGFNGPQILAGDGLLSSRSVLLAVLVLEAAMAIYVLIGNPFRAWWLTLGMFTAFALSAGYALATGQDCNCISNHVGPRFMLPLDLAVVAFAIWLRPVAGWC